MRKHLNADALFNSVRTGFDKITDHRSGDSDIALTDALMSGFAVFSFKDPSLLAFDQRRRILFLARASFTVMHGKGK
jgi:hypothetical protein